VEFDGDERRGLTAVCRRQGERHRVSLADLVPGPVTLGTALQLAAYRRWLGLASLEPGRAAPPSVHRPEPWVTDLSDHGG
jgi:hypothetical protein